MADQSSPPVPRVRVRIRPPASPTSPQPTESKGDYEVGYGRPPKSGQFKKGMSGCPSGRKPGSRNAANLLVSELNKPIKAKVGGRTVRMTRLEAIMQRFIERCLAGEMRAIALLLKIVPQGPAEAGGGAVLEEAEPLSPAEKQILEALFKAAGKPGGVG